jgi:uncharacterized membrane protein
MSTEPVSSPTAGLEANIAGLLCYLFGWISGLIFLLLDKRPFVRFHAAQSIAISIAAVAIAIGFSVITAIVTKITSGFGILLSLLFPVVMLGIFIAVIICMIKAFKNEKFKLPVIGNMVEKMIG